MMTPPNRINDLVWSWTVSPLRTARGMFQTFLERLASGMEWRTVGLRTLRTRCCAGWEDKGARDGDEHLELASEWQNLKIYRAAAGALPPRAFHGPKCMAWVGENNLPKKVP